MIRAKFAVRLGAGLSVILLFLARASAQSTISGQVKDTSGAAMAGVAVEASSEALIERARSVVSNGEGRYAIVDVRPGSYTVTFTLMGFNTVKQQVEVPANVTVPVDASMQVGSIGQTVEVAGLIATVDVDNVSHPEVLTRSDVDSVPTARNLQSVGSYIPSVHLNIPDVGGSQQIQQTYIATHGNPPEHNVYLLDSMLVNTTQGEGQIQTYIENELVQEATYSTVSNPVDSTAGGVFVNLVPKDGGNNLHGEFFGAYTPSSFVGTNLDANLIARFAGANSAQSAITELQDFDGSLGGPINKDRLWFLLSGRKQQTYQQSPLCLNNGSPCVDRSHIYTGHLRRTYQANAKNKFSAMWMRDFKRTEDEAVTNVANGRASQLSGHHAADSGDVLHHPGEVDRHRYPQADPRGRFFLRQAGLQRSISKRPDPGALLAALVLRVLLQDTGKNLRYNVGTMQQIYNFDRYVAQAGGFYVTGSHQIKFGIQDSWGPAYQKIFMNGDLYAIEANGVPTSVSA